MTTRVMDEWTDAGLESTEVSGRSRSHPGGDVLPYVLVFSPADTSSVAQFERTPTVSLGALIEAFGNSVLVSDQTTSRLSRMHAVPPATSDTIRALHDRSGLTWDELAKVIGVSRRALHHWARGGRLNAYNAERLHHVYEVIRDLDTGDPGQTRQLLIMPREAAPSIFQEVLRERVSDGPREGFYPDELLRSLPDNSPGHPQDAE